VVRLYRTLHRALADAPLDRNPAALPKHMRPVVREKKTIIRPTAGEIGEFLDHTARCERSVYMYPLMRLAGVSGMRRGELVGLAWPDVDLDEGTVSVERSLGIDGSEVFVKAPKSEAGVRLVGLDPETVDVLRSHRVRLAEDRLSAGAECQDHPLDLDLVFRMGSGGRLIHPNLVSRSFTREWVHFSSADRGFAQSSPRYSCRGEEHTWSSDTKDRAAS
jgi:integrase